MTIHRNRTHFVRVLVAITITLFPAYITSAQEDDDEPAVETQLLFDRTNLTTNESGVAILSLHNTTPYTLTNVAAELQGTTFELLQSTPPPNLLPPFTSVQAEYTLQSQTSGSQNLIFTVRYSWYNLDTNIAHQQLETVFVEGIEIFPQFSFDWPEYLIPLIIGLVTGQLITLWADRRKQKQEERQREEQVSGVALVILQAAKKGIEIGEPVSFDLWRDVVVKGNLYPALHQLGRNLGKPELSRRLAELPIRLADYNERQEKKNLTDTVRTELLNELADLIRVIENRA